MMVARCLAARMRSPPKGTGDLRRAFFAKVFSLLARMRPPPKGTGDSATAQIATWRRIGRRECAHRRKALVTSCPPFRSAWTERMARMRPSPKGTGDWTKFHVPSCIWKRARMRPPPKGTGDGCGTLLMQPSTLWRECAHRRKALMTRHNA